jgi:hypothetical protein
MKRAIVFACVLTIGALVSNAAMATVPDLIPVQGVLADAEGAPLDGAYDLTFSLYAAEIGGAALWTGAFADVDVAEGFFTVYLGSVDALDFSSLIANPELWLGMAVEADPEMNRMRLATVPFAIEAQVCEAVGSLTEEDINASYAPISHTHATPVLECVTTAETVIAVPNGATLNAVAPTCAAGYTATSTNCKSSSWDMPSVYNSAGVCSARNNSGASATMGASQVCCRVADAS